MITKIICLICLIHLTACSEILPGLFQSVENIANDDAIEISVDRDAIKKDTDIHIAIDIVNKDPKL